MTPSRLSKPVLVLSGATAIAIALLVLLAPEAFYQSYGISLGQGVNLVNELTAPAGMLLLAGGVMLAGVVFRALSRAGLLLAVVIYCGYALSRCLNMAVNGLPEGGLIMAAGIEALIGGLALVALMRSVYHPLRHRKTLRNRGRGIEDDAFVL